MGKNRNLANSKFINLSIFTISLILGGFFLLGISQIFFQTNDDVSVKNLVGSATIKTPQGELRMENNQKYKLELGDRIKLEKDSEAIFFFGDGQLQPISGKGSWEYSNLEVIEGNKYYSFKDEEGQQIQHVIRSGWDRANAMVISFYGDNEVVSPRVLGAVDYNYQEPDRSKRQKINELNKCLQESEGEYSVELEKCFTKTGISGFKELE